MESLKERARELWNRFRMHECDRLGRGLCDRCKKDIEEFKTIGRILDAPQG